MVPHTHLKFLVGGSAKPSDPNSSFKMLQWSEGNIVHQTLETGTRKMQWEQATYNEENELTLWANSWLSRSSAGWGGGEGPAASLSVRAPGLAGSEGSACLFFFCQNHLWPGKLRSCYSANLQSPQGEKISSQQPFYCLYISVLSFEAGKRCSTLKCPFLPCTTLMLST